MSHPLWQNLFLKKEEATLLDLLHGVPVFDNIASKDLALIQRIIHRREYQAGEIIFSAGEPGNGMYIIQSGEVEIYAGDEGETHFATLEKHQFFGELALLDHGLRSASARAVQPAVLFGFFKPDLMELIEKKARVGSQILLNLGLVLGERLRATNEQLKKKNAS